MRRYAVPPGYQRQQPVKRPKLGPWRLRGHPGLPAHIREQSGLVESIPDRAVHRKQMQISASSLHRQAPHHAAGLPPVLAQLKPQQSATPALRNFGPFAYAAFAFPTSASLARLVQQHTCPLVYRLAVFTVITKSMAVTSAYCRRDYTRHRVNFHK
jgi:hypothetical protein